MLYANVPSNIYPERLDYVDQVLSFANEKVTEFANSADLHSQATQSQILSLLLAPIKTYMSLFTALALPSFIPLLHSQPYPTRRAVAGEVARSLLRNQTPVTTVENLDSVLEILKVLIKEGIQQASGYPGGPIQRKAMETDETIEEQGWLAKLVHLIQGSDNDTQFKVRYNLLCLFDVSNHTVSSFKLPVRPSRTAMSVSNSPPHLSSLHLSNSPAATKHGNTSKIIGLPNPLPSTNLCTTLSQPSTLASPVPQTCVSVSLSAAAKLQTRTGLKRSHTSFLHKHLRYTRRVLVIQELNSRLFALLRVRCTRQGILGRKIMIHLSRSARFMEVSC